MKNDKGKQAFLAMLDVIVDKKAGNSDVIAELGTVKGSGILPDSYPSGEEPDDDYLVLSGIKLKSGDRVLIIWTADEDMVVVGKVEGDDNDG